jgi:hypothetical protein
MHKIPASRLLHPSVASVLICLVVEPRQFLLPKPPIGIKVSCVSKCSSDHSGATRS